MFIDDYCSPFAWRKTTGSSLLVTYNLIVATVWRDILFIYSTLDPEDTWMKPTHAWLFVVKLGGMRGGVTLFL